jgi:hypothetical protein
MPSKENEQGGVNYLERIFFSFNLFFHFNLNTIVQGESFNKGCLGGDGSKRFLKLVERPGS